MNPPPPNSPEQPSPSALPVRPKRRVRYSGKHPQRFEEKYKELDPAKHPETIAKVIASGKTPAGTHRPILVDEILQALQPAPGHITVDCTLGYGGHAVELLRRILPGGRLLGIDTDPLELPRTETRLRELGYPPESLVVRHSNFAGLLPALASLDWSSADLILADLGVSSMQLDNPSRGFSFKADAPLDLRMNPRKGAPASHWLDRLGVAELARILQENADEPKAEALAETMLREHAARPIATTFGLRRVIERAVPDPEPTLRRVFQALRILVNDEFAVLEHLLRSLPDALRPGGRVAILTFHSGEDRRVKKSFQLGHQSGLYRAISEDPVRPSPAEVHANPRAASAKLRWAIRA